MCKILINFVATDQRRQKKTFLARGSIGFISLILLLKINEMNLAQIII
jgi:hypothetical protein